MIASVNSLRKRLVALAACGCWLIVAGCEPKAAPLVPGWVAERVAPLPPANESLSSAPTSAGSRLGEHAHEFERFVAERARILSEVDAAIAALKEAFNAKGIAVPTAPDLGCAKRISYAQQLIAAAQRNGGVKAGEGLSQRLEGCRRELLRLEAELERALEGR